jgi:ABC-type glycerol-3-phosphate transport system permease component
MKNNSSFNSDKLIDIINYFLLTVLLITTLFPFIYIFVYSLTGTPIGQRNFMFYFENISLDNYKQVIGIKGFGNATTISLLRTVLGTALTVGCCSLFAFLVTKDELPFRKIIYRFAIISMYIEAGFIPWYITMRTLGLKNNFLLYILPTAIVIYYVILIKTYIEQLPKSLEESAKIDGAGVLTIFFRIIFPISTPILATIAVFSAVMQWNTWIDNYFLVQNENLQTLQLKLYELLSQANNLATKTDDELMQNINYKRISPMSIKVTMTMVVTLPILFVYPMMQKYFVKGIMLGAVKG